MGFEFNGMLFAFAYEDGPLVELDCAGHMIRIVTSRTEHCEIVEAMEMEA